MKIRHCLDSIIDKKMLKILRLFVFFPKSYTGRRVSAITKLNNRTCRLYLEDLYAKDILNRDIVGRSYLYSLQHNYYTDELIVPIIEKEKALYINIKTEIVNQFESYCHALVIYGSYASYRETDYSDLDLLLVVKKKENIQFDKLLDEYMSGMSDKYSIEVSPHIVTLNEFESKKNIEVFQAIMNDGDWLYGEAIKYS